MPKIKKNSVSIEEKEKMEINPILKDIEPEIIIINEKKFKINFPNYLHEFRTIEVIFITLIMLIIGFCIGYFTFSINTEEKTNITVDATEDESFNKIIKTYNYMIKQYINTIDKETLIDGAIEGMLNKVDDPYTSYYNEKETTTFYKELKGTFYGIGCAILKSNDLIYVVDVLENSPAKKSGVLVNDIIKEVNNKSTEKLSAMEVVNIIEDAKKEIILKIIRDNNEIIINMNKDNVVIKSVIPYIHEKNNKKIGYIKINLFALNTYEQFKEELLKLEKNNIDSLIIDVRDNEGGYLTSVSNIVSLFFDKDTVIYQLKTKTAIIKKYSLTNEKRNYNVVILQNNGSASGSEILAGVFKEMYKSEIIGTNSYGKSSVQQTVDLGDGTMFKYTTRQWLTSLGNNIGGFGIEPTIIIEQSEEYYKNKSEENDTQLQKALSILSE